MESELVTAFITAPSRDVAQRLAQMLVERGLAACVNLVGPVTSVYSWQGSLQQDQEILLILKTSRPHLESIAAVLAQVHPYEVPELIALPIVGGLPAYLSWIEQSTRK